MASVLTPSGNVTFVRLVELGTVYTYVEVNWGVQVGLTGIPAVVLSDGLGNTHKPERASPHIATMADWEKVVRWRFVGVPAFDSYTLQVPLSVAGIVGTTGNTTAAGNYAVVAA